MVVRRRTASAVAALALTGSAAAVTVSAVATAGPASADAGGNSSVQYCRSVASLFPGLSQGACVSYYQSHDRSAAATDVYFCKTEFVPAGDFANLGSCVSFLNQFKGT
jgi:hypothetical protein